MEEEDCPRHSPHRHPSHGGRRELACKQDDTPFSVPAQRKGAAHCRVCSGMTRILYITIIYIIIYIIYNSLAAQRKGAAHCRVCSDMTRILYITIIYITYYI